MDSGKSTSGPVAPVALVNESGNSPFVLVCDHASNRLPSPYDQTLGLSVADKQAHIAWDPGALGTALHMSALLDAPLVHSTISRLVIDCNRDTAAHDLIPALSERTEIPGNVNLSREERARRIALAHAPFHGAIEQLINDRLAQGTETVVVSVHTYTPVYKGIRRQWEIGLIYDRDASLAFPALEALRRDPALTVGDNAPYSPRDGVYYTLRRHGEDRGLKALMIEIRNDEVARPEQERLWGEKLAAVLSEALAAAKAGEPRQGEAHA
ncbi:N-formylglutamate amidohydrolase [Roseibium sp. RKSG952]|uniref:N-formylglutamate amidohydrolase n=1 Tax=Roseibium sp. RKSG952 TaxID=2529384 RepID=UPI0012BC3593|nr:N-formylglutamate amidohydrolase [Roseibium sp. RKSG952]MTH99822.1 N-formylglutamate amidohydrolase [Roseibium sp. RKSG952]